MKQLRVLLLPLDGMLVHPRVTPSSMSPVPIYTPGWREIMWGKVSCLGKRHDGRDWASIHQPSLCTNLHITTPPAKCASVRHKNMVWGYLHIRDLLLWPFKAHTIINTCSLLKCFKYLSHVTKSSSRFGPPQQQDVTLATGKSTWRTTSPETGLQQSTFCEKQIQCTCNIN